MDAILELIPPKVAAYIPGLDTSAYVYAAGADLINLNKRSLWISAASIVFNPLYWNILARNEYRKGTLQKIFGGSLGATYFFFVTIFSLGILRDYLYERALSEQPHWAPLAHPGFKALAVALFGAGQLFVVTSIYALGLTGTYLGDYCGILMSHRVTSFPFNVLEDPMYVGSTLAFLGTAIWCESAAGLALTALVWVVYSIALKYEGPFTGMIYEKAAEAKAKRAAEAGVPVPAPAPSTPPRKSERLAEAAATTTSATAAPTATGNGAATPRRRAAGRKSAIANETLSASPMRVTRSRSKARSDAEGSE
ncbi:PEMT-domain-containing protein [Cutaneotrichosporon oleaginosum]|uniref:Phosphatidyl-N-methylethanolamine N-methyltransferase n=1 Tax=Cutaneotrichosporon oleaginosum TaxID=879819 RepID=A0A0J1BBZ2_9TREE|nr:PEMT-domain-containing protein [Cutaneotrichosporon oleaginosum]KLT45529.1 PEMT-domain-containing protein [Cutaneotrichosporon oleaginosum]TXT14517.1 hypothetical protein COLE_00710 [Cutaneotrichosporon oleaginosum]